MAAWLALNKIDVVALLKDGDVQFEVIKSRKAVTYFNLYNQLPRVMLHDYALQLQRLSAKVRSLREVRKG